VTTAKRKSSKPNSEPQAPELDTVRIHDLVGAAAIVLPAEMRDIFDDETYQGIRNDIENHLMTMIVRRPGHIVYVHANLMALEPGTPAESAEPATQAKGSGDASAVTAPKSRMSKMGKVAAKPKAREVTASATARSSTPQSPAKRTAAKAGKSSRRQPKGKA